MARKQKSKPYKKENEQRSTRMGDLKTCVLCCTLTAREAWKEES